MKISEIITDKYKLRIPPTVYYDILADVYEAEEDQEQDILDKIREEIETERNAGCHTQYAGGLDFALSIIDKYRAESEGQE